MTEVQDLQDIIGRTAVDSAGDKIGKIGQIYLDDQSGQPRWVTISTGLFGTKESFAPLQGSRQNGENLQLAVTKDLVKDAPKIDADGHLDDSENDALYAHYAGYHGVGSPTSNDREVNAAAGTAGNLAPSTDGGGEGRDMSGPNTDNAMTRSEEQLHVGTESVETGRARLRKYVVTENVTTTVPVSHEEIRVEREPITDATRGQAMSGQDISEEEHEITLHAEQPVVSKETVPVERVKMSTDTVTEDHTVTEEVRKEQIDAPETDGPTGR
jgi:uncharacterized protein (TIGR02271 family)